ncbi:MAG TPA: alanine--tRNA ligase [Tissierellaceae bacterium]|nr:alanine--tRNA ligase [Tissierellaceae bacterium]
MEKMGLHEIRKEFLDFFREKDHLVVPSFSLVPKDDKSLLLIGAGMAPLKKYFTGEATPPEIRMATCQKCIRTGDLENVGKTDRHATFFEMLGNFSFGDYFKKEASEWAWEFLTQRLKMKEEDLWVTVYLDDDEAYDIWKDHIGVPEEKIIRLGKEHNFWELEIGPSGPCSEIYFDRGIEYGCGTSTCAPGCDCDRFVEIWNLVFTQFDKDENGVYNPLPNPNIDTGLGLERVAAVMEGVKTIFDTKALKEVIEKIEEVSGVKYGKNDKIDTSVRVITDHSRAMTFLVSDGVLPSNEGRGYILRRIIRRAARHGKLIGIEGSFLRQIVQVVIESWKVEYPEIKQREEQIKRIIKAEEDKFQETIHQGIEILENYIKDMNLNNTTQLAGDKAFKLYDTYGFPLDLTKEILEEKSLTVDETKFDLYMEQQRNRARKARDDDSGWVSTSSKDLFQGLESKFKGYESISLETVVIGLFVDNESKETLNKGEEAIMLLKETPFYGEAGGQIGDTGIIEAKGFKAKVIDTKHTKEDHIIHLVKALEGSIKLNDKVVASVEDGRRNAIKRNHSATHLLHQALRDVLGDHVNQAGSVVMDNRLRFDFTHFEALTDKQLKEIEEIVNSKILDNLEVRTIETTLKKAQEMGVIGLFDEKYGDLVRVLSMGDYSMELCGGTHVSNTGNIGLFKITSESSIASGVRRIEAITGNALYEYISSLEEDIEEIANITRTNKDGIIDKVKSLTEDLKEKEKEIEKLKSKRTSGIAEEIIETKKEINGISVISYRADNMDMNELRKLGDGLKDRLNEGVIVLGSVKDGKVYFVSMVTPELIKEGIKAGDIVREVAKVTGGSGGGRPDMAQAGGKDISKVDEALSLVYKIIDK